MAHLSRLTDRTSVEKAIAECDRLGQAAFLKKYGFGPPRDYFIKVGDKRYPSKAIIGVAYGKQHPNEGALKSSNFIGGRKAAARRVVSLGFDAVRVSDGKETPIQDLLTSDTKHPKVFFMNIGSMEHYQGEPTVDKIRGNAGYLKQHGFGWEIYNFKPYRGRYYGAGHAPKGNVAIEAHFDVPAGGEHVDDVLVVWVANGHVVGWYKNARLYRTEQLPPKGSRRMFRGNRIGYYATASVKDCHCLPSEARTLPVPTAGQVKGGMGRYIWYPDPVRHRRFLKRLFAFIEAGGKLGRIENARNGHGRGNRQSDPEQRRKVEDAAMRVVDRHFTELGYAVTNCCQDNRGWDMEAELNGRKLLLEAKGLSGANLNVELTSNEFAQMKKNHERYRVCVVLNSLQKRPKLSVFRYVKEADDWQDEDGVSLVIEQVTSARLHL